MELIRHLDDFKKKVTSSIAVIGNLDGVHLGHQHLISQAKHLSEKTGLPLVLVFFEPQPQEFFQGKNAPARLTNLHEKLEIFSKLGVHFSLCLRFSERLSRLNPEAFIQTVLIEGLGVHTVVVGENFHFGFQRAGTVATLEAAAKRHGFICQSFPCLLLENERISSTRIRGALAAGLFEIAEKLLGRPYAISGRVIYGDQRGRLLNVPTANILLKRMNAPLRGVFWVLVQRQSGQIYAGVANFGLRPTVNGKHLSLEVHILNFSEDIYGERLSLTFLKKWREEQAFESLERLKMQINKDLEAGRQYFVERGFLHE